MSVAWESDDELDIELVSDSGEEETEGELRSPGGVSRRREGTVERPAKRRKADASGEPSSLEQRRVLLREASGTAARWDQAVRKSREGKGQGAPKAGHKRGSSSKGVSND